MPTEFCQIKRECGAILYIYTVPGGRSSERFYRPGAKPQFPLNFKKGVYYMRKAVDVEAAIPGGLAEV